MEPNIDNIVLNLLSISQFCSIHFSDAGRGVCTVGKNPIMKSFFTDSFNVKKESNCGLDIYKSSVILLQDRINCCCSGDSPAWQILRLVMVVVVVGVLCQGCVTVTQIPRREEQHSHYVTRGEITHTSVL